MGKLEIKNLREDLDAVAKLRDQILATKPKEPTDSTISIKPLIGKWVNCDPNAPIVRIEFGEKSGSLTVHVFGKCHPTPCDWGVVPGIPYAESVAANEVVAFSAFYDHGFAERIVTGHFDVGALVVEIFTKFKDNSGRSNYYLRVYLCKREG